MDTIIEKETDRIEVDNKYSNLDGGDDIFDDFNEDRKWGE